LRVSALIAGVLPSQGGRRFRFAAPDLSCSIPAERPRARKKPPMVNYEVVDYTLKPVEGDDQVELVIHASDGSRWEYASRSALDGRYMFEEIDVLEMELRRGLLRAPDGRARRARGEARGLTRRVVASARVGRGRIRPRAVRQRELETILSMPRALLRASSASCSRPSWSRTMPSPARAPGSRARAPRAFETQAPPRAGSRGRRAGSPGRRAGRAPAGACARRGRAGRARTRSRRVGELAGLGQGCPRGQRRRAARARGRRERSRLRRRRRHQFGGGLIGCIPCTRGQAKCRREPPPKPFLPRS
jgi:hypothetical protein